jgi:hypothetical protein
MNVKLLLYSRVCVICLGPLGVKAQPLTVYHSDGVRGNYVVSRTYLYAGGGSVSEVIVADSFSTRVDGAVCQIVMSNAYVFTTKISVNPNGRGQDNIVQDKMHVEVLKVGIPKDSSVILDSQEVKASATGLARKFVSTNFNGESAEKKLREMGLSPDAK